MAITIASNINALRALKRLADASEAGARARERLASGLRINRASDDAAGLAISSSLNADARVYNVGIRNINDGISLLNVAEGATQELTNITIRIKELAEQAANGSFSSAQRNSLNTEAQQLRSEWNRIIQTTKFNGINLIDGSLSALTIQQGYTSKTISLGSVLSTTPGTSYYQGDGTFSLVGTFSAANQNAGVEAGDLNGDGISDIVTGNGISNSVSIYLGNSDGTLKAATNLTANGTYDIELVDVSGDGVLDIIGADENGDSVSVFIGNGNGTFKARTSYAMGSNVYGVHVSDLNGDGSKDIVALTNGNAVVLTNGGAGTFTVGASYASGGLNGANVENRFILNDFNRDGRSDLLVANYTANTISVLLGNADGSFAALRSYSTGQQTYLLDVGDYNEDGNLDYAFSNVDVFVALGNGDGTFKAKVQVDNSNANYSQIRSIDLNGDGNLDLVTADGLDNTIGVLLGNGNGTFSAKVSYSAPGRATGIAFADFNGDGVTELIASGTGNFAISVLEQGLVGNGSTVQLEEIDLTTQSTARTTLDRMSTVLDSLGQELGRIGSYQSTLNVYKNVLMNLSVTSLAAAGRIRDADVAEETAALVRSAILEKAAAEILGQANLSPSLALKLLT